MLRSAMDFFMLYSRAHKIVSFPIPTQKMITIILKDVKNN